MIKNSVKIKQIIIDEVRAALDLVNDVDDEKEPDNEKKLIPAEDEEDNDDDDLEEMNKYHDVHGQFSDEDSSRCTSTYFVDKKRKRKAGGLTDKHQTGRGPKKTGQGKYRCLDNEPKWESLFKEFVDKEEKETIHDEPVKVAQGDKDAMYDCAKQRQEDKALLKKLKKAVQDARGNGSKSCPLSYEDAVRVINTLEKASKGKAFDPPK